jgi:putative serine protease PepD
MDPTGPGRVRGFRAPSADETARSASPGAPEPSPGPAEVEVLESGPAHRLLGTGPGGRRLLAGTALALVGLVVVLAFRLGSTSAGSTDPAPKAPTPTPAATATPLPVPELFRQVVPSVVLITTSKGALGSGTVVTDAGVVLTAAHVVAGGGSVSILFADGTRAGATVTTTDKAHDIATLLPKKLPEVVVPATLGGGVVVGADVVALGNPLGLRDSASTGVVSGLDRRTRTATGSLSGLIQFDAAVNPGSSGGPLLDARGLVIGVVVSIADPGKDDAFAGIGFAVPIGSALGGGSGPGDGAGPRL